MERPLDDRRVGDDLAVDVEDEVKAPDRVLPVVLGEAVLIVRSERGLEQLADRPSLGRAQLVGSKPSQSGAVGRGPHGIGSRFRGDRLVIDLSGPMDPSSA
jgi:hypothetical protein